MCRAVEKAGRGLVRDFNELEHLQVSKKGLGDFVSTADYHAEKVLVAELQKARPTYGFIVEESGIIEGEDPDYCWIVDPLDGTSNFLHGIPHFAISLALERRKEIIAGVIYNPAVDELYWAEKGQGTFLNQRRLRVSARKHLDEALLGVGIPFGELAQGTNPLTKVLPEIVGARRFGATALDLAFVASGRFDGCFINGAKAWDIAAGILMVKEAGGYVSEISGGDHMLTSGSVMATNEYIFTSLKTLLHNI
jgi:myo-inositol-1(or 4)-monophosphatase